MSNPKQHHFVPQVYLRNFCYDATKNQLYFLDKVAEITGVTSINNIAKEKDFYTDVSLDEKYFYEHFFSNDIEPLLGQVIDRIVSRSLLAVNNSTIISEGDRKNLSKLIVYQMLRTRKARDFIRTKANSLSVSFIDNLMLTPLFQNKIEYRTIAAKYRVLPEDVFKEISLPLVTDFFRVEKYCSILDKMLCVFYKNETDLGFITGDNPVIVTRVFSNLIGLGSAGLSHQDCVIAFPLNPRIAVLMFHPNPLFSHAMGTYSNREYHVTKVETIQQFNKWQFIQANRQVYSQTPIFRGTFDPLVNELK